MFATVSVISNVHLLQIIMTVSVVFLLAAGGWPQDEASCQTKLLILTLQNPLLVHECRAKVTVVLWATTSCSRFPLWYLPAGTTT